MRVESEGLLQTIEHIRARIERVKDLTEVMRAYGEAMVTTTDNGFKNQRNYDGTPFAPLKDSTLEGRASRVAGGTDGIKKKRRELREKLKAKGKTTEQIAKALHKQNLTYQYKRISFATGLSLQEKAAKRAKLKTDYQDKRRRALSLAQVSTNDKGKSGRKALSAALRAAEASYKRKLKQLEEPSLYKILIDTARARNSNHVDRIESKSLSWSAVGYLGYHMSGTHYMAARNPTPFVFDGDQWVLHDKARELFSTSVLHYIQTGENSPP